MRQFYPIYVDKQTERIIRIGEPLTPKQPLTSAPNLKGAVPVFPIREDGKHMNWGLTGTSLKHAVDGGFVRILRSRNEHQPYNFTYLTMPSIKKVKDGIYHVDGVREDGSKIIVIPGGKIQKGTTSWKRLWQSGYRYFFKAKKISFPEVNLRCF